MKTLLDEQYAPVTSSIGFVEATLDEAARALHEWRAALYDNVRVARPAEEFPESLRRLEPLLMGVRCRELLVPIGKWTAYFDNLLTGTDASSTIGELAERLGCHGVAVTVAPGAPDLPGRPATVRFELFGPVPTHFLNYVRTISVAFDGDRWRFDANGVQQPFEEPDAYKESRIHRRFTPEMLERYCRALGIEAFDASAYGPESALVESDVNATPDIEMAATIEEAREIMRILDG